MKNTLIIILLVLNTFGIFSQQVLILKEQEYVDTETGSSQGINIPRSQKTLLQFLSNTVTSVNSFGYLLQAGDENPLETNNNLDGSIISGNKFTWNGTDATSMTHALFTGYNVDVVIKYNYLLKTPNGIQRKSNGMTDVKGVIAYNILKNPKLGVAVKGISGIRIYNNTFYSDMTSDQTLRGLIDIHKNTDNDLNTPSKGTKVYNNIFHTRNRIFNINVQDVESLEGFESDYNLFWCEAGDPIFQVAGSTKTFAMWQAMGYDLHSVVINPNFIDLDSFVPAARLDYGKDLGPDLQSGLAVDATWNRTAVVTENQNGKWQVGARVVNTTTVEEDEELPDNMALIYPNPAYGKFYLLLTDFVRNYRTMKIFNSNGKLVLTKPVEHGRTEIPVPESFASGMYTITLEGDNLNRYIRKLIILK